MCKRTQQLRALLRPQCWELLRTCWQWCANGCNNSQQCWDLQCNVGRIQPISLCKACVMSVRCPNNVGRAVQTDPTLLRDASAITEQKKCWELLAEKFVDRFQTFLNNRQQLNIQQHATGCANGRTCNIQKCWELLANNAASVCTGLNTDVDNRERAEARDKIQKRRVSLKEKPENVILAERLSSGHQGKNERQ